MASREAAPPEERTFVTGAPAQRACQSSKTASRCDRALVDFCASHALRARLPTVPSEALMAQDPHDHSHSHAHDHGHSHDHSHDHGHSQLRDASPDSDTSGARVGHDELQHRDVDVMGPAPLAHSAGVGHVLHLDAFSGIAGDMLVAALLDLGVPREPIDRALACLPVAGYRIDTPTRSVHGIVARRFVVNVEGSHPQRTFRDIRAMLNAAPLLDGVRSRALATFSHLAEAEGRVHRMPPDDVHFHEVGAVDAIVDIVSASAALEWLGARVSCAPLPMGRGFVRAAHGVLPVPAPAVVEVLHGVPTVDAPVNVELVTPTGAALVRANATSFTRWPSIRPVATGFGAGTRVLADRPNMLRVVLGVPDDGLRTERDVETHAVLEANLDDVSPQVIAHAAEVLLREGALDTWTTPIGMKKGRPGVMLSAVTRAADRARIGHMLLEETPTLGLRWRGVARMERPRRTDHVETRFGTVPVKVADGDAHTPSAQPEFEVCRELARTHGVPVRTVHAAALAAWWSTRS